MRLDAGSALLLLLLSGFVGYATAPHHLQKRALINHDTETGPFYPGGDMGICPSQCAISQEVMVCHHADGLNMVQLSRCVNSIRSLSVVELSAATTICSCSLLEYIRLTVDARVLTFTPTPCGNTILDSCSPLLPDRSQSIKHRGLIAGLVVEQDEPGWREATKRHLKWLWNKVNSLEPMASKIRYRTFILGTIKSVYWSKGTGSTGFADRILPFMLYKYGRTSPLYEENRVAWFPVHDLNPAMEPAFDATKWMSIEDYRSLLNQEIKAQRQHEAQEIIAEVRKVNSEKKEEAEEASEEETTETTAVETTTGMGEEHNETHPEETSMSSTRKLSIVLAVICVLVAICIIGFIIQMCRKDAANEEFDEDSSRYGFIRKFSGIKDSKDNLKKVESTSDSSFRESDLREPSSLGSSFPFPVQTVVTRVQSDNRDFQGLHDTQLIYPTNSRSKRHPHSHPSSNAAAKYNPEEIQRRMSLPYSKWTDEDFELARQINEDSKEKAKRPEPTSVGISQVMPMDKEAQYRRMTEGKPPISGAQTLYTGTKANESWTQVNVFDIVDAMKKEEQRNAILAADEEARRAVSFHRIPGIRPPTPEDLLRDEDAPKNPAIAHRRLTQYVSMPPPTDFSPHELIPQTPPVAPPAEGPKPDAPKTEIMPVAAAKPEAGEGKGEKKKKKKKKKDKGESGDEDEAGDKQKKKRKKSKGGSESDDEGDGSKQKKKRKKSKGGSGSEDEGGDEGKAIKKRKKSKGGSGSEDEGGDEGKTKKKRKKSKGESGDEGKGKDEKKKKGGADKEGDSDGEGKSKKKKRKGSKSSEGPEDKGKKKDKKGGKGDDKEGKKKKKEGGDDEKESKKKGAKGKGKGKEKGKKRKKSPMQLNKSHSASSRNNSSTSRPPSPLISDEYDSDGILPKQIYSLFSHWTTDDYDRKPARQRPSRSTKEKTCNVFKVFEGNEGEGDLDEGGSEIDAESISSSDSSSYNIIHLDPFAAVGDFMPCRSKIKGQKTYYPASAGEPMNSVKVPVSKRHKLPIVQHPRRQEKGSLGHPFDADDGRSGQPGKTVARGKDNESWRYWFETETGRTQRPKHKPTEHCLGLHDDPKSRYSTDGCTKRENIQKSVKEIQKEPKLKNMPKSHARHSVSNSLGVSTQILVSPERQTNESWKRWFIEDTQETNQHQETADQFQLCLGLHNEIAMPAEIKDGATARQDETNRIGQKTMRPDFLGKGDKYNAPLPLPRKHDSTSKNPLQDPKKCSGSFNVSSASQVHNKKSSLSPQQADNSTFIADREIRDAKKKVLTFSPKTTEHSYQSSKGSKQEGKNSLGAKREISPLPKPRSKWNMQSGEVIVTEGPGKFQAKSVKEKHYESREKSRSSRMDQMSQKTSKENEVQQPTVHFCLNESDGVGNFEKTFQSLTTGSQSVLPSTSEIEHFVQTLERTSPKLFSDVNTQLPKIEKQKRQRQPLNLEVDTNLSRLEGTPQTSNDTWPISFRPSDQSNNFPSETSRFSRKMSDVSSLQRKLCQISEVAHLSASQLSMHNAQQAALQTVNSNGSMSNASSVSRVVVPSDSSSHSSVPVNYAESELNVYVFREVYSSDVSSTKSNRKSPRSHRQRRDVLSSESQMSFRSTEAPVQTVRAISSEHDVGTQSSESCLDRYIQR